MNRYVIKEHAFTSQIIIIIKLKLNEVFSCLLIVSFWVGRFVNFDMFLESLMANKKKVASLIGQVQETRNV